MTNEIIYMIFMGTLITLIGLAVLNSVKGLARWLLLAVLAVLAIIIAGYMYVVFSSGHYAVS